MISGNESVVVFYPSGKYDWSLENNLTISKQYDILAKKFSISNDFDIWIKLDNGETGFVNKKFFITVDEYRDKQLNEVIGGR